MQNTSVNSAKLTLGPLLHHWTPEARRDFYFRVADEMPVDSVYLGEVICSKREPFFEDQIPEVIERLKSAGKEVVISTLALVTLPREVKAIRETADADLIVEANDVACLEALHGRPHVIGPFINVFNEGARDFVAKNGAFRVVIPVEAPATSIKVLADNKGKLETEVLVFGKQTLSIAMRCYHARANGLTKDSCQFVCGTDPNGLNTTTVTGDDILTINGTSTMSNGYGVLLHELDALRTMGVTHFRLSPQAIDMVEVARIYRDTLDGKISPAEAEAKLRPVTEPVPYVNGFYYGRVGLSWNDKHAA